MRDLTQTSTLLLEGLRDPANAAIWAEFDRRYRPIVIGLARQCGVSSADAADVGQETLARFIGEYQQGRYDRTRGRLRNWLIAITRTQIAMHWRRNARQRNAAGDTVLNQVADDTSMNHAWDQQQRRAILREALVQLQQSTNLADHTREAFELLVCRGLSPRAVADRLQISVDEVYVAKSRAAAKLRPIVAALERAYEEDVT